MAWRGSLSRSLISTARASTNRPSQLLSRHCPPPLASPRIRPRRFSFANPRNLRELGGAQSLMPLYTVVAGTGLTSHLAVDARACCELYHGTFCRTCQDR
ncbi:hypothetical protein F0562_028727 [Nyssa sinensis]|uniref:Uncharacterized protein n=1 Tax=Nyssa sinensis TaxID=561372 RepID=A0A5J5B0Q8_9ASTE|nr:hypothetical protein F0562_028727 [Nyssa sinensis]